MKECAGSDLGKSGCGSEETSLWSARVKRLVAGKGLCWEEEKGDSFPLSHQFSYTSVPASLRESLQLFSISFWFSL
jgi:hypothetical protein